MPIHDIILFLDINHQQEIYFFREGRHKFRAQWQDLVSSGKSDFFLSAKRVTCKPRSRSGFSRRSLIALLGACGTRVPDHRSSNGIPHLLLASPFDHFRLRQPRRQEVPSKDDSGRLNLQWALQPSCLRLREDVV